MLRKSSISKKPPGSFYIKGDRWWWKVKLPGTGKRKDYKLAKPGSQTSLKALPNRANEQTAWSLAWRIWEKAAAGSDSTIEDTLTVGSFVDKYLSYCEVYYKNPITGKTTHSELICGLRHLNSFRNHSAESITPIEMGQIRDLLLAQETPKLSITTINKYLRAIQQLYKWGVGEGLIDPYIEAGIARFPKLKPGRTTAKPAKRTEPANPADVKATLPELSPVIRDMVLVQWICDMRPSELISMQSCFIDKSDPELWLYIPENHKNKHRGKLRVIPIFPEAREILEPYLARKAPTDYIFSPKESADQFRGKKTANRQTPLSCGNTPGSNLKDNPLIKPGDKFSDRAYPRAIRRAIDRINRQRKLDDQELMIPWAPRQLRHAKATENRALAAKAIAAILLGHAPNLQATDAYTWQVIKDEAREKAKQEVREAAKKIIEIQKGSNYSATALFVIIY